MKKPEDSGGQGVDSRAEMPRTISEEKPHAPSYERIDQLNVPGLYWIQQEGSPDRWDLAVLQRDGRVQEITGSGRVMLKSRYSGVAAYVGPMPGKV